MRNTLLLGNLDSEKRQDDPETIPPAPNPNRNNDRLLQEIAQLCVRVKQASLPTAKTSNAREGSDEEFADDQRNIQDFDGYIGEPGPFPGDNEPETEQYTLKYVLPRRSQLNLH